MRDKRWLNETSPTKLLMKLHEEVGEVTHAYMRQDRKQVAMELHDAALILERLTVVIAAGKNKIPEVK